MNKADDQDAVIDLAVHGDRAALERLLLDHYAALSDHVSQRMPRLLQGATGVEDIVQQTYAQVFAGIASYQRRPDATFFSWLATIAENRLRDVIRAQKRKKRGGDFTRFAGVEASESSGAVCLLDALVGSGRTPSQSLAAREAIQAIQVAVAGLPPDYRQAIQLRYLDGYTLAETAALMRRSPGAVRGLLDRAKKKLHDSLERASHYLSSK